MTASLRLFLHIGSIGQRACAIVRSGKDGHFSLSFIRADHFSSVRRFSSDQTRSHSGIEIA
jgi:hypothetical protein